MDKPSTSGLNKQGLISSPAAVSTPKKQKLRMAESPKIPPPKIRKIANDLNRESQLSHNLSTRDQNLTQRIDLSQIGNDNPLACIFNRSKTQSEIISSIGVWMKSRFEEMELKTAQALLKEEKLQRKLETLDDNGEEMKKHVQAENKRREVISEEQNIAANFQIAIVDYLIEVEKITKGFKERDEQLDKIYKGVVLKFHQEHKDLNERNVQELLKMKVIVEQSESKGREVLLAVAKADQQLRTKLMQLTQIDNRIDKEQEECHFILDRHQQQCSKEINKIDDNMRRLDAELNTVQGVNIKTASGADENSKRKLQLLSECETLKVSELRRKEQINDLNHSIADAEQKQASTRIKIEELKRENLAIISETDLQHTNYRKQLEDLTLKHTEKSKKLSDIESSNEMVSNSITQSVDEIEELEKISHNRDCEILKLKEDLNDVESNKDLSAEAQSLEKSLIDKKEQAAQEQADYENFAAADQSDETEIEMLAELADVKQQSKDIADRIHKVQADMEAEAPGSFQKKTTCAQDIERLDEQLGDLQKTKENCQQEIEIISQRLDSENAKKIEEVKQSLKQCQLAGQKIDALRIEISEAKAEYEKENTQAIGKTRKKNKERETEFDEFESEMAILEKRVSAAEKTRGDLKRRLEEAKVCSKAYRSPESESVDSSPLISSCFTKKKSQFATSTPQHSPQQAPSHGLWNNFGFGESSESSINSSDLFEDMKRRYEKYKEANKTDAAKLNETEQSVTSS